MLGLKPKPEKIREKQLDKAIERARKLKKLIKSEDSGWGEYMLIIENYLDSCKKQKALRRIDRMTDEEIYQMKLLDFEIFIVSRLKDIPYQYVKNLEKEVENVRKKEENQVVN